MIGLSKTKITYVAFHCLTAYDANIARQLLARCGDVEQNPGPTTVSGTEGPTGKHFIGTYNTSGCKKYGKLKRLMASLFKLKNFDRFIFSLQETHISISDLWLISSLWREGITISPSTGKARGIVTVFSNNLFDHIIHEHGSKDGRSTWIVGSYNSSIDLFVSIYSPNSGKNAEFYTSFFAKINSIVSKYDVDNVYISGDFNI